MKELEDRKDIEMLLSTFYVKVLKDPVIGYLFTDVAQIHLESHLPVLCDFWESTLFHTSAYRGNPMKVHQDLHHKHPLTIEHFDRWILLFHGTVDELFEGTMAERAKQRATSIRTVMQLKLHHPDA